MQGDVTLPRAVQAAVDRVALSRTLVTQDLMTVEQEKRLRTGSPPRLCRPRPCTPIRRALGGSAGRTVKKWKPRGLLSADSLPPEQPRQDSNVALPATVTWTRDASNSLASSSRTGRSAIFSRCWPSKTWNTPAGSFSATW